MINKNLKISELDILGIKQNLINFLKNQEEFNSYNFEGSALNVLMDILAYNTYYNAYYNNITISEMFLDSALKRSSIVSLAKHFNYLPKTITAATTTIEITTTSNSQDLNNFYIPKYTTYITNRDGENIPFVTMEDIYFSTVINENQSSTITKKSNIVTLKQGKLKTFSFIYDIKNQAQKFVIPFQNVDFSTLVVKVQPNPENTEENVFYYAKNITEINGESNVYFVEESSDGFLRIFFGDGILGTKLKDSSVIRIEIIETIGEQGNGVGITNSTSIFTTSQGDFSSFSGNIPTFSSITTKVIQPSFGGSPKETKDNIKFNAIRNYTTAERAVTKNDYKNIILKDNPYIQDVIVWGGEENSPPDYGKVFICAKPIGGSDLSTSEKNNLIESLTSTRNVVGIQLEIVQPNTIYLNLNIHVKVDPITINKTTNIKQEIRKTIDQFFSYYVRKFDADFYSAELIENIQNIDDSIISNNIDIVLEKRFIPNFAIIDNYIINFDNELNNSTKTLTSNLFGYTDSNFIDRNCQLEDDGLGNISLYYNIGNKKIYINKKIGTINYKTGSITLNNFKPSFLVNNYPITIQVIPKQKDIIASKKTILEFDITSSNSLYINEELIPYRNK